MLLPSSLLAYGIARWLQRHHSWWPVQAFRLGMAPVVLGLLGATGWVLARGAAPGIAATPPWALWLITAALVWCPRMHLLWLLAAGAALGVLGLV